MPNKNSDEDSFLRATVIKEHPYRLFVESLREGYYIDHIQNDGINNNGEQQFSVFLKSSLGHSTVNEHKIGGKIPQDFLINYYINTDLDGFGTEADGHLKIHFEEADEVPA
ncbi:hypothetical protein [Tenacibaculum xiamenense]|uniref:hypothetical protein n=1 Tax=Tenacibaculum xiamenense TaxID=1261553 RepID=UPI003896454F